MRRRTRRLELLITTREQPGGIDALLDPGLDRAIGEELRPKRFADDLSVALLRTHTPYVRSDRASTREFLVRAFQVVSRHRGDIVTAVSLGMGKP